MTIFNNMIHRIEYREHWSPDGPEMVLHDPCDLYYGDDAHELEYLEWLLEGHLREVVK